MTDNPTPSPTSASSPIKGVIFDFGGVITKTLFETHAESERALGLAPNTLRWRGPFEPEGDPLWRSMQAGEMSERDYWHARTVEVGDLIGENWQRMSQLVGRIRGDEPDRVIRPEALETIERLHRSGFKLAILSNELELFYGDRLRQKLPFLEQFDTIVDASYSDVLKPDPRAYRRCLEQLNLTAEQCIFIDDQKKNIQGGRAVGMAVVHFDVRNPQQSYRQILTLAGLTTT